MLDLEQSKLQLNIEHNLDDILIQSYIDVSLAMVEDTLGFKQVDFTTNEVPEILIEQGQRILVAEMYRDREETTTSKRFNSGIGLKRLLSPYSKIFIM